MDDNEESNEVDVTTYSDARQSNNMTRATKFQDPTNVPASRYGDWYDMTGDKHLIVFNQHEFKKTVFFNNQKYSTRSGTFNDVESLKQTFGNLGFKVVPHTNLDYDDIMDEVIKLCNADHEKTSCVAIAVLTHGEKGGEVCAADRPYPLNDIISTLQSTPGFAGKPKLIFVQACRGQKIDGGQRITLDGVGDSIVIPTHADTLVLFSSFEDHLSYRDSNGSWMIQALCEVVSEHHQTLDVLQMLTLVLRSVALRYTNVPSDSTLHNKKQMPEARFTLTKFLRFPTE